LEKGNTAILICKKLLKYSFCIFYVDYFFGKVMGIKAVQKYRFFQSYMNLNKIKFMFTIIHKLF